MITPRLPRFLVPILLAVLAAIFSTAHAHPVAQGSAEMRLEQERVTLILRVSNEQVFVAESIGPNAKPANSLDELWQRHGNYVRDRISLMSNGAAIPGDLVTVTPPTDKSVKGFTTYALIFPAGISGRLELRQNFLQEIEFAPGNPWEATFVVRILRNDSLVREAVIWSAKQPLIVEPGRVTADFTSSGTPRIGPLAWDYFVYGLHHIAAGWDHILFVAALVLAVPRLWPVLALVTVFTLAHTVTLSLAVMRIVSAPSTIVEPIIAVSIVIAAGLNLFRTNNPPLAPRLAVAFGFGLFHGLGFASGLIAAMEGFRAPALAAAIAGFSVGVEAGHQLVVIPLVLILWGLRRFANAALPFVTRTATIAVLLAGLWLLYFTMRPAPRYSVLSLPHSITVSQALARSFR